MNFILADHAIDRFIQRCAPGLGREEAWTLVRAALPAAAPLKEKTPQGHRQWRLTAGEYAGILVTRPAREPHHHVVVTVLPATTEEDPAQELLLCQEMLADATERLKAAEVPVKVAPRGGPRLGLADAERARHERRVAISTIQTEIDLWRSAHKTARAAMVVQREVQRNARLALIEKGAEAAREAKHLRILASNQRDREEIREALRIAVRGLMTGQVEEAKDALRAGALPGILEPGFWDRQAATKNPRGEIEA